MTIALKSIALPEIDVPLVCPTVPPEVYASRADATFARAGVDWVVVYADREHQANIAFLTGFEPRFEEALLLLGSGGRRILIAGNESSDYARLALLPGLELMLCQSMSLMGQDRSRQPDLEAVLREAGLARGQTFGVVGWKYFDASEWHGSLPTFQASAFVVDLLRRIAGNPANVVEVTPVLMHPQTGLRAVVDIHQIAAGEWGAARASMAVWRIVAGIRPGDDEFTAASRMGYAGEELSVHTMLASSPPGEAIVGLRSPRGRVMAKGDGVTTAIGYWGGLSSRAGLLSEGDDGFLAIARAYFAGLIAWYETTDIGVTGGAVFAAVNEALARGGLRSALNPGHLVGIDEWMNTPIRPGSPEAIVSGMPFQVDIIPTPVPAGQALNCEDGVVIADADLRAELKRFYPHVSARIEARRSFMADHLGVALSPAILPLSNTPLCLPPFWLSPGMLLGRD